MLPKIEKILYASALGAGAPCVCRYALSVARQCQARVTVLHVIEPLSTFGQSLVELHISHADSEAQHAEARSQVKINLEQELHELIRQETVEGEYDRLIEGVKVVEGQPAEQILLGAEKAGADLIIVGSHRHSAIGDALLGHTASKVTHRSKIPVLLAPIPDGYPGV
ncbi:MAG: hypothetical protein C0616_15155 [Desulfuromonas sp.]|nr:MAG: hypothetical protein C0616_15155 [Desulfuromonas sp.]